MRRNWQKVSDMGKPAKFVVTRDGLKLYMATVRGETFQGRPVTLDFRNAQNVKLAKEHAEGLLKGGYTGTLHDFAARVADDVERYAQAYEVVRKAEDALKASKRLLAEAEREAKRAVDESESRLVDARVELAAVHAQIPEKRNGR